MKEIAEEVLVDENLQLLNDKHKDIMINKNSHTIGDDTHKRGRRSTEPNITNGNDKSQALVNNKSHSFKDIIAEKQAKAIENGASGKRKFDEYSLVKENSKEDNMNIMSFFILVMTSALVARQSAIGKKRHRGASIGYLIEIT